MAGSISVRAGLRGGRLVRAHSRARGGRVYGLNEIAVGERAKFSVMRPPRGQPFWAAQRGLTLSIGRGTKVVSTRGSAPYHRTYSRVTPSSLGRVMRLYGRSTKV